jgi:hypothetical protein
MEPESRSMFSIRGTLQRGKSELLEEALGRRERATGLRDPG